MWLPLRIVSRKAWSKEHIAGWTALLIIISVHINCRCASSQTLAIAEASSMAALIDLDGDGGTSSAYDHICMSNIGNSSTLWVCSDVATTTKKPGATWILAGILPWPLVLFCCWLAW